MNKAQGLRKYLYEFVFHQAVERAREQSAEIIPISEAKRIRARIDEILTENVNMTIAHPELGVRAFLSATDQALLEQVRDYEEQFGDHTPQSERFMELQQNFVRQTGIAGGNPKTSRLPISPYDPEWSERATMKRGGTALAYIADETIQRLTEGETGRLSQPRFGNMMLWRLDDDGKPVEAGRAMTFEDASGLTALMDKMSVKEYNSVRDWVISGGRDPETGQVDRNRFMSQKALARSIAVLDELRAQGIAYEVQRDRGLGQIKARIPGTGLEVRLIDPRQEEYAGARIYDNGTVLRFSTNQRVKGGVAVPSVTPEQAVDLLRFAQGQAVMRQEQGLWNVPVGQTGLEHRELAPGRDSRREVTVPDSYFLARESMFVYGDHRTDLSTPTKLLIRRDAKDRTLANYYVDAEAAEEFARGAVESARKNLGAAIDVERIIAHYEAQQEALDSYETDDIEPPEYASDTEVAAIQRSYWDVLTGVRDQLLRPGATEEMVQERLEAIGELSAEEGFETQMGNLVYHGSPADKIRQHADDVPFELIGTFDPEAHDIDGEWVDQRFDPGRVAKYMTSAQGQWANLDNLAAALRKIGVPPEQMLGNGFQSTRFKDRLVTFDERTAQPIDQHDSPFIRSLGDVVRETLSRNATVPGDVLIDEQGVIRWTGEKTKRTGDPSPVTGEIGQVFPVGEYGEVITRFASGENSLIVPGYEARIVAQKAGENKSVEERTLLRGYEQLMRERIQYQISGDLMSGRSDVGEPASLNGVYSGLYGTKHPVDFIERSMVLDSSQISAQPSLDPWTRSIIETEARRVRYSNEIKQGSTIFAEYQAERDKSDPADDNRFGVWDLTHRNMAVLTGKDAKGDRIPEGFFDPVMTGGATNQGIVRYLTADAVVRSDGSIEPGDPETLTGSRAPLMTLPELETLQYDPFDRQQMTASTIMQSSKVTEPTGTALMTFGGWTADDPIVVSKEFADEQQIRGAGGKLRGLVVGDKLSDLHGNKGVISLIVDRNMDLDEAEAQGLRQEVSWFRENPQMDVVMSPFSLISRRNAGSARELMTGDVSELQAPDVSAEERLQAAIRGDDAATLDRSTPGGQGQMRFVVTHMAVDEKTKIYDEEQIRQGKGRKASSQLAWALQAQDSPAIMAEFYGHNSGAEANLREYLLSTGLDMEADGTLRVIGKAESLDEHPERRLFEMPDLILTQPRKAGGAQLLNTPAMRRQFGELIGDKGGDLEIPFALTYPTGEPVEQVSGVSWKMPILSSHLRSGQEFDDGSSVMHDYTRNYQDVFIEASKYRYAQERLDAEPTMAETQRHRLKMEMSESVQRAQRSFDFVNTDIQQRVLSGKNNIFKTGLMSSRLGDSATMVWTADPRLDIDQVALSSVKAQQLGLKEGDHALVWRDPVLRDAGIRYLRVAIDDRLTGAAVNPVIDKSFDGDFDGDAVGVAKLHTKAAHEEALAKLSVPANILDTGTVLPDGSHPLSTHVSLDTQVAISKNPLIAETIESLRKEANIIARDAREGEDPEMVTARREDVVEQLSAVYRVAQRSEFGSALTFSDREAHLQSVREVCVETGAKGSEKKLADYAKNLGDEAGTPGITQEDQEASMFATAIKAHGTGLGGSFSQRAVRALRGEDLKAVLEVTYPVTQSILQAKHDAAEARHKYEMLQGPGRELWRGRKMEHLGGGDWRPVFEDGKPVQATAKEWTEQFIDFYESPVGFNVSVNPEYVGRVANALKDPQTGVIRNLDDDPTLRGTLMDRMAYGGDFETLKEAALARESIFDGEKNAQFASAPTRRALRQSQGQLDAFENGTEWEDVAGVSTEVLKSDVLAPSVDGARARADQRRSAHVATTRTPRAYTPTIEITEPVDTDEYERQF